MFLTVNLVLAVPLVQILKAFLARARRTNGAPPILAHNERHSTTSSGGCPPSSYVSGVHYVRVPGGGLGSLHARLSRRFGSVNTGVCLLIVPYGYGRTRYRQVPTEQRLCMSRCTIPDPRLSTLMDLLQKHFKNAPNLHRLLLPSSTQCTSAGRDIRPHLPSLQGSPRKPVIAYCPLPPPESKPKSCQQAAAPVSPGTPNQHTSLGVLHEL